MGKITLPVVYPTITTFPPYADALAIMESYEECLDWVFSHYIQVAAVEVLDGAKDNIRSIMPCFFVDFDNRRIINTIADSIFLNREINPFLNIFEIPNTMIEQMGVSYVSFIRTAISQSMYVYAYCDISKIREYNQNASESHEVFIYGFDDERRIFQYADFPNNRSHKYMFSECSYDEIEKAFNGIKNVFIPIVKSIGLVQYESRGPFTFNMEYVKESIVEYLYPDKQKTKQLAEYIDSFVHNGAFMWNTELYWGINVYDYFIRAYIKGAVDIRLVHAMYEHKKMMVKRLEYFRDRGYLNVAAEYIDRYQRIEREMIRSRNLVLKYNMTHDIRLLKTMSVIMSNERENEHLLLSSIFGI